MKTIATQLLLLLSSIISGQIVTIPDQNFKNALISQGIDANNDKEIQLSEASVIKSIRVTGKAIKNLTGIEAFENLDSLLCDSNDITELDLVKNISLVFLECSFNKINKLNVANCIEMKSLICWDNQLTQLDLSNNTVLRYLDLDENMLQTVDISKNINLDTLYAGQRTGYELNSLDVSKNEVLKLLWCSYQKLQSLDLSHNPELQLLNVTANLLTTLNISNNLKLTGLMCPKNKLNNLDLTKNTKLRLISCSGNDLYNLDVTSNTDLIYLSCYNNKLTGSLNLFPNVYLQRVECSNNQLQGIDLTNNLRLKQLNCSYNKLQGTLNLSKNDSLTALDCQSNIIQYICVPDKNKAEANSKFLKDSFAIWIDGCSTGVSENELKRSNLFYPNPVSDVLTISSDIQTFSIYNSMGQLIYSGSQLQILTADFPTGIYSIVAVTKNNLMIHQKIIKH